MLGAGFSPGGAAGGLSCDRAIVSPPRTRIPMSPKACTLRSVEEFVFITFLLDMNVDGFADQHLPWMMGLAALEDNSTRHHARPCAMRPENKNFKRTLQG